MQGVLLLIILSLCVIYVDFHRTKENMSIAKTNGINVLPYVVNGNAPAPAQYRILVPWLTVIFSGRLFRDVSFSPKVYLNTYVAVRAVAITLSLCLCAILWKSELCTMALAMFYMVVAIYDYTESYFEIAFLALATILFQYNIPIVMLLVCIVAGINRETAVVIPLFGIPDGGVANIACAAIGAGIGVLIPRLLYRNVRRSCALFQWTNNWRDIKLMFNFIPLVYNETFQYFILASAIIAAMIISPSYKMFLALALFALFTIPARIREVRVFAPCVFLLIPVVLG